MKILVVRARIHAGIYLYCLRLSCRIAATHVSTILFHFEVIYRIEQYFDYIEIIFDNIGSFVQKDHSNVACQGKHIKVAFEADLG